MTWDAMITDEQNRLQRGRQLARLTKPELIDRVLDLEYTTDRQDGSRDE